jgi:hypothetical protein
MPQEQRLRKKKEEVNSSNNKQLQQ